MFFKYCPILLDDGYEGCRMPNVGHWSSGIIDGLGASFMHTCFRAVGPALVPNNTCKRYLEARGV